ncbi:MAG: CDP-alcohol phosphatidyltransferase family protein [Chloroflexota bacterium]|nr:CDP-alcohol phosphatidyltransferase family protein [Chloroflexota bacterium]
MTPHLLAPPAPVALSWDGLAVCSWPNLITTVRTVLAVALGLEAVVQRSATLLLAAYGVYWVGDVLDGWVARRLDQETRLGAVLDIISDRACCAVLVCGLASLRPELWPALALFLLQFMVLDCVLSLAFLRWPLTSPNYFYLVDRGVWRLNWSPPAKALNTVAVVGAVAAGSVLLATTVAAGQLALKAWSARRVLDLEPHIG